MVMVIIQMYQAVAKNITSVFIQAQSIKLLVILRVRLELFLIQKINFATIQTKLYAVN
jgi:hypothetical protein